MAAPGDRLADRYELIEPIGSGGMAIVWRARDLRLRRTVAVKVLRPQFAEDPGFVERFDREARHAASLAHENVAAVYDTGVERETRFIVMELVDGGSVADLIQREGRLAPSVAIDIAAAAARALAAAHRRGLVHRDVKPANLLIGRDGRVRLADFGIARALSTSRVTTVGILLGSGPYMSPEQRRGEEAMAPGDIYSLGVVLYEMLNGELPPAAAGILPAGLDAVVGRALEADPARRYPSARAFAEALDAAARRLRGVAREEHEEAAVPVQPTGGRAPVVGATTRSRMHARTQVVTAHGLDRRPGAAETQPRRRRPGMPVLFGFAAIALSAVVGIGLLRAAAGLVGGVLQATGTPGIARATPAISSPSTAATAASFAPSPPASPSPSPSPFPTPAPTLAPTPPPPTPPPPTPAPTPVVVATPRPTARPAPAGTPAGAVTAFYGAVEDHDWDTATALWSASMQRRYPPEEWLIGRFSRTTRIDIIRIRQTALNTARGTATVAITLVEHRSDRASPQTIAGSWDLVRVDGSWLLNNPRF
jgi:serine/threonine protein kinase